MDFLCSRQCVYLLIHLSYMVMETGAHICESLNFLILYSSLGFFLFYLHVILEEASLLFFILCFEELQQ